MGYFLNMSSVMMCPHGGQVQPTTTNTRTKAMGDFILRQDDTCMIVGCPFMLGLVPHPCVRVQWIVPAMRNTIVAEQALTDESVGLCLAADEAPQGTVIIVFTQPRAAGL